MDLLTLKGGLNLVHACFLSCWALGSWFLSDKTERAAVIWGVREPEAQVGLGFGIGSAE